MSLLIEDVIQMSCQELILLLIQLEKEEINSEYEYLKKLFKENFAQNLKDAIKKQRQVNLNQDNNQYGIQKDNKWVCKLCNVEIRRYYDLLRHHTRKHGRKQKRVVRKQGVKN